jgi:precorrin-6B methylase 2
MGLKMKTMLKNAATWSISNDALWTILDATVLRLPRFIDRERRRVETARKQRQNQDIVSRATADLCPDLVVRKGVFAGMRYAAARSVYSALLPKLLGTYVDIGCAEGYYAVGMAMRCRNASIYAFDTNVEALELCRCMAEVNGVANRLTLGTLCDRATLARIPLRRKALIISDCEGYEKALFDVATASLLRKHDVLVEVHDFVDISTSRAIRAAFRDTHDIIAVESIDDIKKAHTYQYPELDSFDLATRRLLLAEHRPATMEWLFMAPKSPVA